MYMYIYTQLTSVKLGKIRIQQIACEIEAVLYLLVCLCKKDDIQIGSNLDF